MGGSLRDQLLKKGMATKKQAKAAAADVREKAKQVRKQAKAAADSAESDAAAREAARVRAERAERDRELNRQRETERAQKAMEAQARDLVIQHRIQGFEGDIAHHFTHGNTIKSLRVDQDTHAALGKGRIAIACIDDQYVLVPAPVAEKVYERFPDLIVKWVEEDVTEPDPDDPYAEFPIPDDLMW